MKSATERDAMVKRVHEVFAKYPTFEDVPKTTRTDMVFPCASRDVQADYVEALYNLCSKGRLVGRNGGALVGEGIEST